MVVLFKFSRASLSEASALKTKNSEALTVSFEASTSAFETS